MHDDEGRVPCVIIRSITGKTVCHRIAIPKTPQIVERGPMTDMLAAMLASKCPRCNGPINGELDFNGAVLALPCRHVLRGALDD